MSKGQDVRRQTSDVKGLQDPPVAQALFGEVRWAWIWLILRLYAGYEWLNAAAGKWQNPAWTGPKAGAAISGFAQGALQQTGGAHPNVQGWYAWFLQHVVLPAPVFWSYLITVGETLVGIALVVGIFTGIAALFGAFMNYNYLLSGAVSSNPILLLIALFLVLAWKTAGWWGLDRWVLPALGTPWSPGKIFQEGMGPSEQREAHRPGRP
jgi:thiosulfate dehydrogenase [quinone] large subunit